MLHTLLIKRSSFVLITLQVTVTFTCGREFYYLNTTSQPSCKVVTTLQGCEHIAQIATTLLQLYKVDASLLQPSYFCMGKFHNLDKLPTVLVQCVKACNYLFIDK